MTCHKMRINEQYQCPKCGLSWDCDDTYPPACRNNTPDISDVLNKMIHDHILNTGVEPHIIYVGRSQLVSLKRISNYGTPVEVKHMVSGDEIKAFGLPVIEVVKTDYLEIY